MPPLSNRWPRRRLLLIACTAALATALGAFWWARRDPPGHTSTDRDAQRDGAAPAATAGPGVSRPGPRLAVTGPPTSWMRAPLPDATVAGLVLVDGEPAHDATVTLRRPSRALEDERDALERTTDTDGRFFFGEQPAEPLVVGVTVDATTRHSQILDLGRPTDRARAADLVIELSRCGETRELRLVDATGNPIPEAWVQLEAAPRPFGWLRAWRADAGADGRVEVCETSLHRPLQFLSAGAPGYARRLLLEWEAKGTIVLTRPATLRGTVRYRGESQEGVLVRAGRTSSVLSGVPFRETLSAAAGHYQFEDLIPGCYEVYAWRGGEMTATRSTCIAPGGTRTVALELGPCAVSVSGTVMDGDRPRGDALVGIGLETARTGADGRFRIPCAMSSGEIWVRGRAVLAPDGELEGTHEHLLVRLAPATSLEVRVTREGRAVPGAIVTTENDVYAPTVTPLSARYIATGDDGRCALHLEPGTHTVFAYDPDSKGESRRERVVIDDRRGAQLDLSLPPTSSVRGTLRDTDGAPVAGAPLSLKKQRFHESMFHALQSTRFATTDQRGRFSFPEVAAGQYSLRLLHGAHFASGFADMDVDVPTKGPLQLRLEEARRTSTTDVTVNVVHENGSPVPGAYVRCDGAFHVANPDGTVHCTHDEIETVVYEARTPDGRLQAGELVPASEPVVELTVTEDPVELRPPAGDTR